MKTIFNKGLKFLVYTFITVAIVSCNDTSEIEEGVAPTNGEPYSVTIGFGLTLQPGRDMEIIHNYEKTGYKVEIKKNLVAGDITLEDVDLTQSIILEVTGPVEVTVKHPDFKKKKLGEIAYYGLERVDVETAPGAGVVQVPLELVQGYVAVEANELMAEFIQLVKIGRDEVALNTIYYTDETKKDIEVEVRTMNNEIKGEHQNEIGEGVVYEVELMDFIDSSQSQKTIEFDDVIFNSERIVD